MSPDFRLHYDRLRENDPTKPENEADEANTRYETLGHARMLCLVWPDGRRQFLNYAYLVGGTFTPGEEVNEIRLDFSTHTVTLKGYSLATLFTSLLDQLPKQILQAETRYATKDASTVTNIMVQILG